MTQRVDEREYLYRCQVPHLFSLIKFRHQQFWCKETKSNGKRIGETSIDYWHSLEAVEISSKIIENVAPLLIV
jgi:hypothetical protein